MLVRIPHHPGDARQRGQFLRRPLRVTTRHQNSAPGIHSLQPAYRGARIFIRSLRHRARVEHDDFRLARCRRSFQSSRQKLPLQRCPIRLRRPATEIFDVEARHIPILPEPASVAALGAPFLPSTRFHAFGKRKHERLPNGLTDEEPREFQRKTPRPYRRYSSSAPVS